MSEVADFLFMLSEVMVQLPLTSDGIVQAPSMKIEY